MRKQALDLFWSPMRKQALDLFWSPMRKLWIYFGVQCVSLGSVFESEAQALEESKAQALDRFWSPKF